ncbi:YybH family protein [Terrilactibacillus laevilacticus]|uniref:YybH family protein n=1 Tax=Terrilactibacillus laevilacticus TaxID=1380157 RepID=A0ABW5PNR0_9BACI|nr:nuclear transport factor 2 family protein [Terrilactibacillus laevilacticus]
MSIQFNKVQDILENYKTSTYEKNVEKFLSAYASDVHIYDCWENWEYVGIDRWREMVVAWFDDLNKDNILLKTDFDDLAIEEDSRLAFIHCKATFAAHNPSGEILRQLSNRFTFCIKKENDSWLITHEHSSLPIKMETGKGIFD